MICMSRFPRTPTFDLTGKRALVAGASSGIGLACAVALAEHGAKVTLAARSGDKLTALAKEMTAENWSVNTLPMDVADVTATAAAVAANGPFDILVNSAGMARHSKAVDTTPEDFDAVSAVNIRGAYFLTQAVAKGLLAAGKPGSLINISSQMAHVGGPDRAVYCASKHAVLAISEALRIELSSEIKVTTVSPGSVNTAFIHQTKNEQLLESYVPSFESGLSPEIIAQQIKSIIELPKEAVMSEIIIRPNKATL